MSTRLLETDTSPGCPASRHFGRKLAIWPLLGTLLLLSGCAEMKGWVHKGFKVGPDYFKPAAPIADAWIDFNDPRVISDGQGVDHAAWWQSFNDPVLDGLVHASYQQNLPLRVAGMRVLEAQAQRRIAAGEIFPQFQESFGQYNHVQLSQAGNSIGITSIPRTLDLWNTGFNVGWELDVWGKFRRQIESADANLDAMIENYDDVLVSLIAETARAYVDLRQFEQRLAYAQANVEAQEGSLKIAEARFRAGETFEIDVTMSTSVLEQTRALVPLYEMGTRQAGIRLCQLLGIPSRDLYSELGPGKIPQAPPEVIVGIPAELLRRRPDVRRAERDVAAQSALIGVATADLFPEFTINGTINWQAGEFPDLFTGAANAGSIGPAFNWKILHYGRIRNGILVQDARFQQLAIQYQQKVIDANAEVEDAIVSFLKTQEQVQSLRKGVTATQRSLELANIRWREGQESYLPIFIFQSALVTEQDGLAAAEAEVAVSLIRLFKALGGGWQIRYGYAYDDIPPMHEEASEP
ncbi:MAG: efflux transporter outer membrane subunit [Pirellulaceae bacterium]